MVYSKPSFGALDHVLMYLTRYTNGVTIYNGRHVGLENVQRSIRCGNSRHNNPSGVMPLEAIGFIRRFQLQGLPSGFMKIRNFGVPTNRNLRPPSPGTGPIFTPPLRAQSGGAREVHAVEHCRYELEICTRDFVPSDSDK